MIMSSFLINPVSGATLPSSYQQPQHLATGLIVDPKFPPTEEYSQNNYIPSTGGDFFSGHHLNQPQHHLQYSYHNHHQGSTPYGPTNVSLANGGYGSYGNYYHPQLHGPHTSLHPHQIRPPIPVHPEPQQSLAACHQSQHQPPQTPVTSSSNILQNLADIAPVVTQPSEVNSSACSPISTGHGHDSRSSPTGRNLQDLGLRLEDNASDEQDDIDEEQEGSPLLDDDDEEDESGDRVIYPWMKKIHVSGACKYLLYLLIIKLNNHSDKLNQHTLNKINTVSH